MKSFYLTLISGSNQVDYNNTAAKFTNKLPIPLELGDDVEFGICELSYKRQINNIPFIKHGLILFDHFFEVHRKEYGGSSDRVYYGNIEKYDIKEGWYKDEDDLCSYFVC